MSVPRFLGESFVLYGWGALVNLRSVSVPKSIPSPYALLCLCILLSGCQASEEQDKATSSGERSFAIGIGDAVVQMEIAMRPRETQRGLMFRESLPENGGMLFLFEQPDRLSFWMRNTSIPLDIGYFDRRGRLREIYQLYPYDERSVASQSRYLQYALEVNQGWFAKNEIRPGAQLDLEAVIRAVEARGGDPDRYGLRAALAAE